MQKELLELTVLNSAFFHNSAHLQLSATKKSHLLNSFKSFRVKIRGTSFERHILQGCVHLKNKAKGKGHTEPGLV